MDDLSTLTRRERLLLKHVTKAMRADFDAELQAAVQAERQSLLYGLKSLATLNGSGHKVLKAAGWDESQHPRDHGKFSEKEGEHGGPSADDHRAKAKGHRDKAEKHEKEVEQAEQELPAAVDELGRHWGEHNAGLVERIKTAVAGGNPRIAKDDANDLFRAAVFGGHRQGSPHFDSALAVRNLINTHAEHSDKATRHHRRADDAEHYASRAEERAKAAERAEVAKPALRKINRLIRDYSAPALGATPTGLAEPLDAAMLEISDAGLSATPEQWGKLNVAIEDVLAAESDDTYTADEWRDVQKYARRVQRAVEGVGEGKVTKAFDESKHPRDHGKFTSATGTPHPVTPHLHALAGKVQGAPDRKAAANLIRQASPEIRKAEREHERGLVKQAKEKAKEWAETANTGSRVRKPLGAALARLLADDPNIDWGSDHQMFSHRPTDALRDAHTQVESHGPDAAAEHLARLASHPHHETRIGLVPHWDRDGTPEQYRRQAAEQMLDDDDDFRGAVEKHLGIDATDEDAYDANYESHRAAAVSHVAGLLADWDKHVEDGYGRVEKAFDESKHPRDDHGRFVDAQHIAAAAKDPKKAAELRAKVTDPEQRAKLDAAIEDAGGDDAGGPYKRVGFDKPKAKKPTKAGTGESLDAVVRSWGGIDPTSHSFKVHFSDAKEAMENGLNLGLFRKGGADLEILARELHQAGHINPADGEDAAEHLVNKLRAKANSDLYNATAEYDSAWEEYARAMEEAGLPTPPVDHDPTSFDPDDPLFGESPDAAEAVRSGAEVGRREGEEGAGGAAGEGDIAAGPVSTSPAPRKLTVDQSEALARRLTGASGPDRAETVRRLQEAFAGHTKQELEQLKQRLGVKASGPKAEMARKLAERAAAFDRSNRNHYVNDKVSVEEAHGKIKDMAADGSLRTPDGVRKLTSLIAGGLTGDELKELKAKLGVKASGAKLEVARKLVERATKEKAVTSDVAAAPAPHPASVPVASTAAGHDYLSTVASGDQRRRLIGEKLRSAGAVLPDEATDHFTSDGSGSVTESRALTALQNVHGLSEAEAGAVLAKVKPSGTLTVGGGRKRPAYRVPDIYRAMGKLYEPGENPVTPPAAGVNTSQPAQPGPTTGGGDDARVPQQVRGGAGGRPGAGVGQGDDAGSGAADRTDDRGGRGAAGPAAGVEGAQPAVAGPDRGRGGVERRPEGDQPGAAAGGGKTGQVAPTPAPPPAAPGPAGEGKGATEAKPKTPTPKTPKAAPTDWKALYESQMDRSRTGDQIRADAEQAIAAASAAELRRALQEAGFAHTVGSKADLAKKMMIHLTNRRGMYDRSDA